MLLTGALASIAAGKAIAGRDESSVRLLVPFPAGGSLDALARILAPPLGRALATDVIVMNVPGAAGRIAAGRAARARPDGKTLLLGNSATHAMAASLFADPGYRPAQDFEGVGCICSSRILVVASPRLHVASLPELVRAARAAPASLAYGSWGVGSGGHLMVEAIRLRSAVSLTHVPFAGTAPMMQSLLGDQIPLAVSDLSGAATWVRAGKAVPIVVSGATRLPWLPDVGTILEAQGPEVPTSWCGLFVPRRTPEAELVRLERALKATMQEALVIQALRALELEALPLGRARFEALWHEDIAAWARIVAATGIKLD